MINIIWQEKHEKSMQEAFYGFTILKKIRYLHSEINKESSQLKKYFMVRVRWLKTEKAPAIITSNDRCKI